MTDVLQSVPERRTDRARRVVATGHVTTDHVTTDHVTTDHVTTDHVTTDHVMRTRGRSGDREQPAAEDRQAAPPALADARTERVRSVARTAGRVAVRVLMGLGLAIVMVILLEAWRPDWIVWCLSTWFAG